MQNSVLFGVSIGNEGMKKRVNLGLNIFPIFLIAEGRNGGVQNG